MKKSIFKTVLPLLAVALVGVFFATSCEKEKKENNDALFIKKEITINYGLKGVRNYNYNQGLLESIVNELTIEGSTISSTLTITYDMASRPVKARYDSGGHFLFEYQNGLLHTLTYIIEPNDTIIVTVTGYDNNNLITDITTTQLYSTSITSLTKTHYVWENGDIVKEISDTYNCNNGSITHSDTTYYTYDNHPNVYSHTLFTSGSVCGVMNSKHNRIDNEHSYFYDGDRLMKVIKNGGGDTVYYQYY